MTCSLSHQGSPSIHPSIHPWQPPSLSPESLFWFSLCVSLPASLPPSPSAYERHTPGSGSAGSTARPPGFFHHHFPDLISYLGTYIPW